MPTPMATLLDKSVLCLLDQAAKTAVGGQFSGKTVELVTNGRATPDVEQVGHVALTQASVTNQ